MRFIECRPAQNRESKTGFHRTGRWNDGGMRVTYKHRKTQGLSLYVCPVSLRGLREQSGFVPLRGIASGFYKKHHRFLQGIEGDAGTILSTIDIDTASFLAAFVLRLIIFLIDLKERLPSKKDEEPTQ